MNYLNIFRKKIIFRDLLVLIYNYYSLNLGIIAIYWNYLNIFRKKILKDKKLVKFLSLLNL